MSPPPQQHDAFFLPDYVPEEIVGSASSQMMVLNFGRIKVPQKKRKEKKERGEKNYPATFRVPHLPIDPFLNMSSSESNRMIHLDIPPPVIPSPSAPANYSISPPSNPQSLSAIDLQLGEHKAVHYPNSLFDSPATPGLMSMSEYEPLSSPETVLSTRQSTVFDWQPVLEPGIFNPDDAFPPNSACGVPKEVSSAQEALDALGALGISLFQLIDTVLNVEYSTYFRHHHTAFF